MDLLSLIVISLALAMDAFAVALAAGLTLPELTGRHLFRFGFHFGLFQAMMPILGWLAGINLRDTIASFDHWVAFALLLMVGLKMIWDSCKREEDRPEPADPTRGLSLVVLSIATSIDALAIGMSLAILGVTIWGPAVIIGLTAGAMTVSGMLLGRRLGSVWGPRAGVFGGLLLIAIGLKIVLDHTILQPLGS